MTSAPGRTPPQGTVKTAVTQVAAIVALVSLLTLIGCVEQRGALTEADATDSGGSPFDSDAATSDMVGADAATGDTSNDLPPSPSVPWLDGTDVDITMLADWVRAGSYRGWERSPGVFRSTAGGGSRIYLNPVLAASLSDGTERHPYASVGVREITFDDLQTLRGVNVNIKLNDAASADDPDNWMFIELFDLTPGGQPTIAERGASNCLGCHSAASDFVQSSWPL